MLHNDLRSYLGERQLAVEPHAVRVAEEQRECGAEVDRLPERRLHDATAQASPTVRGVHDHAAESRDRKALVSDLDLHQHQASRGGEPALVIDQADVAVLGAKLDCDAPGLEGVLLIALELLSQRVGQGPELHDLHGLIQANRSRHPDGPGGSISWAGGMTPRGGTVIAVVLAALTAAACGSSSHKHAISTSTSTPSRTSQAPTANPAKADSPTVTIGPVHASFKAANHDPVAGKLWPYTVHVTNASGKPLDGTVDTQFVFAGIVVGHETPQFHKLKRGVLHDNITYPTSAVGHAITLVVVIKTSAGSVALAWPVKARE